MFKLDNDFRSSKAYFSCKAVVTSKRYLVLLASGFVATEPYSDHGDGNGNGDGNGDGGGDAIIPNGMTSLGLTSEGLFLTSNVASTHRTHRRFQENPNRERFHKTPHFCTRSAVPFASIVALSEGDGHGFFLQSESLRAT